MTNPRLYDMVFLVVPERDEQAALGVVDEVRKLLVANGAAIEKDESMGRRRLAYQIKKKNEATYHNFLFRGAPKGVTEVERKMRLSEDILRFLTVRVDEEMKHGQKVAKRVKARPRRAEGAVGVLASSPDIPPMPPMSQLGDPDAAMGKE